MVDFAMGGKMLTQGISSVSNYVVAREQFKMEEQMRKHRAAMDAISSASQINALTQQDIDTRDAGVRASVALNLQSKQDKASAEVSAAAAGVSGNSVDAALRGLERSALQANAARKQTLASKRKAVINEKKNVRLSAIYGRDIGARLRPNPAMALMRLGTELLQTYDNNQPKGQTSADALNNMLKRLST